MGPQTTQPALVMDRAYEGNETRQLAFDLEFIPVVPPLKTRIDPWEYNRELYKRRNEITPSLPAAEAPSSFSFCLLAACLEGAPG